MISRLARSIRRMVDPSAMSWWRPQGFDALLTLDAPDAPPTRAPTRRRDGSSADLRERQRDLAFDMYAEALLRLADEDDAAHRSDERETA